MVYLPSSSDALGTKSETLKCCLAFDKNRTLRYFSEEQMCIMTHTRVIRLYEAKWSVVDGYRQKTEVVCVAHTCWNDTQNISVTLIKTVW